MARVSLIAVANTGGNHAREQVQVRKTLRSKQDRFPAARIDCGCHCPAALWLLNIRSPKGIQCHDAGPNDGQ